MLFECELLTYLQVLLQLANRQGSNVLCLGVRRIVPRNQIRVTVRLPLLCPQCCSDVRSEKVLPSEPLSYSVEKLY